MLQCDLQVTPEALRAVANAAMEKNIGARGLRSELVRRSFYIQK